MNELDYIDVTEPPYNASPSLPDNTTNIQAAFTAAAASGMEGATVYIPAGVYMVTSLNFTASDCKLTGGGTLKHIAGVANPIILKISGHRNIIEWIRIDGNYTGGTPTNTDGYRTDGNFNHTRNVHVYNLSPLTGPLDPKGSSLIPFGIANRMHRCYSEGGYESVKDGGDFNITSYIVGLDYGEKGYNNTAESTWTAVIGCFFSSPIRTTAGSAYQIDPDVLPSLKRATFRDCSAKGAEATPITTNVAKFAVVDDVYLTGCLFTHATTKITTLRFANSVGRGRVDNCFLSRMIVVEASVTVPPNEIRVARTIIGDGTHRPTSNFDEIECSMLLLSDSTFVGFTQAGVLWESPESEYKLIASTNCDFNGHATGVTADVRPALAIGGQINSSRRVLWLGTRRTNTGGGTSSFIDTASFVGREILGTTRDASVQTLAWPSDPTTTAVVWTRGDIVANSAPTSGGYYGWVCTVTGPPEVWKQFGLIS